MPQPLIPRERRGFVRQSRSRRGSPRSRGYDSRWDRASKAYREHHPFCGWCEQEGRLRMAVLVDHKRPVVDGGAMYDPTNWWSLCRSCHGRKYEMEEHARQAGLIGSIVVWCDDPEERPARFRAI